MSRRGWRTKEAALLDRMVRSAGGKMELTRNGHLRITYGDRSTVVGSKLQGRNLHNAFRDIRLHLGLELAVRS